MQQEKERLRQRLQELQQQKDAIEKEIAVINAALSGNTSLGKEDKVSLFQSLFIGREDVYATYWVSPDGTKKGYYPQTYTFKGSDYKPVTLIRLQ